MSGIGSHQSTKAINYEWLTPPELLKSLGTFDLDPCSPINRPWPTAKQHYTINDDGLLLPWNGRVWLNPPYGKYLTDWMQKMAMHNDGIALIFARTETACFHNYIFNQADSILFMKGRLTFYDVHGNAGGFNAGAPSVLIAYGSDNSDAIASSGIAGKHLLLNRTTVVFISVGKTWKTIVKTALVNLNNEADLSSIYKMVEQIAPDKIENNKHYQAKVRQVLQLHFSRIKKGQYSLSTELN